MNRLLIRNGTIVLPSHNELKNADLLVDNGVIAHLGKIPEGIKGRAINARGFYISPGFIDLQVNGGAGHNFEDATPKEINQVIDFYVGAGTSGRLGFVDAAESSATFGIAFDRVQLIFPGDIADASAEVDSREDNATAGRDAVVKRNIGPNDLAIGISASGETPFVIGAIQEAKARGAIAAGITNNPGTTLERLVDLPIVVATGPELIAGSTRLKAGTVQKVILNMLSTAAMVSLGKVYDGFMVGLRANNAKLRQRAMRTIMAITDRDAATVERTLAAADYEVDTALVMLKGNIPYTEAKKLLQQHRGNVRKTLRAVEDARRR